MVGTVRFAGPAKVYDMLAGKLGLGEIQHLSERDPGTVPTLEPENCRGGVRKYHDGQFDDARLAVNLAQTMTDRRHYGQHAESHRIHPGRRND